MRAREFTINIPINIKINGDGEPEISTGDEQNQYDGQDLIPAEDVAANFVPPLQQKIELMKHAAGKTGDLIDQITADDDTETS
jgi:hypothetical protein